MKIQFKYPVFPDHTQPRGALPNQVAAQACWYFYLLAEKMRAKVGAGPESQTTFILDGEEWMNTHYVQLANSIALLYGLESPDEFAKHWTAVKKEAFVCNLPTPADEYTRLSPKAHSLN